MPDRAEQKRHRQYIHRRHEVADQRHIGAIEVDRACASLLDGSLSLAELARMEDRDLVTAAAALRDQAAHVAQRLYGRIIFALGIGDTEFPRDRARRACRQEQRDHECNGPRKAGAVVHRQLHPLMMMSMAGAKGSTEFSRTGRIMAILPALPISSIVRFEGLFGL